MAFSSNDLTVYLRALGDELALAGAQARVLVVGGAALILRGNTARVTTGDVDVLAEVGSDALILPRPFSPALQAAIRRVVDSFPDLLEHEWMNAAVARDWEGRWPDGLPPGLDVAEWRTYGGLSVGLAGRETLVPMKLHAVLDRGAVPTFDADGRVTGATVELTGYDRRHLDDLVALAPDDDELDAAAVWVCGQDTGDVRLLVQAVLARVRAER